MKAHSLYHILENPAATHRTDLFLAYSNLQRAFVSGNQKYIIYNVHGTITEQLFDLGKDPLELHNLLPGQEKAARHLKSNWNTAWKKKMISAVYPTRSGGRTAIS